MRALLIVSACLFLFSCTSSEETKKALTQNEIYKRMKEAGLVLLVNNKESGSGAFISADGYIASASHCIKYRDDKLEVISPIFGRMTVKLVALDKAHDFMLLKADLKGKKTAFLPPSKGKTQTPETLYQMGSPIFRRSVLQTGTVARDDTYFEYYGERHNHYIEIIHISATMQNGTSGGPWVNKYGELVGVQSGTLLYGDSPAGIAFMAPVGKFIDVISSKQSARSYNLDFKLLPLEAHDNNTVKRYRPYEKGLVVKEIKSSSVAGKAGLEKWDMIVAINDIPVSTVKELLTKIRNIKEEYVRFTVVNLDEEDSRIKEIPVEVVEDRILFKNPPGEIAEEN